MFWKFGKPKKQHVDFVGLKEKWELKHKTLQQDLLKKHQGALEWFVTTPKQLAATSLATMLLFVLPGGSIAATHSTQAQAFTHLDAKSFLQADLYKLLPPSVEPLSSDQEQQITTLLSRDFHMTISAEENGIRLNRNYGYIGAEQHLARFPGDMIDTHFDFPKDAGLFYNTGMAPGLGAWGYFASSEAAMTPEDNLREKWYIAVPTFLAPGYYDHVQEYSTFFKYKKMLVVNPNNGKAVVADIADSGPSEWTGKQAGGSPEVMHYLERYDGAQKGGVLYFFIHDPTDSIPLGPINI